MTDKTLLFDLFPQQVERAIARLKAHEPPEGYWLAFSGGKDSQCIHRLAELAGVKFDAHFSVTTVDPPELLAFIREHYPSVEWHKPKLSMFQLIVANRQPPSRHSRFCCRALKETGGNGRIVVTGIRAAESVRRAKRRVFEACQYGKQRHYLNPIIDWSDADVWRFIREQDWSYCSLYDEGFNRIGCIMCPVVTNNKIRRDLERWPKFANAYRIAFRRMLVARRKYESDTGKPIGGWRTVDEVWDWWLNDRGKRADPEDEPTRVLMFDDQ